MLFYRSDHTTLFIKLNSDEPLGVLDSDYIEDYNGADGQLTIVNMRTMAQTAVIMVPLPLETPGIPNDVFEGQILLSTLTDDDYEIRGRVRDLVGNYTILTSFANPSGGERIIPFLFTITGGAFIPFPGRTFDICRYDREFLLPEFNREYEMEFNQREFNVDYNQREFLIERNQREFFI